MSFEVALYTSSMHLLKEQYMYSGPGRSIQPYVGGVLSMYTKKNVLLYPAPASVSLMVGLAR